MAFGNYQELFLNSLITFFLNQFLIIPNSNFNQLLQLVSFSFEVEAKYLSNLMFWLIREVRLLQLFINLLTHQDLLSFLNNRKLLKLFIAFLYIIFNICSIGEKSENWRTRGSISISASYERFINSKPCPLGALISYWKINFHVNIAMQSNLFELIKLILERLMTKASLPPTTIVSPRTTQRHSSLKFTHNCTIQTSYSESVAYSKRQTQKWK